MIRTSLLGVLLFLWGSLGFADVFVGTTPSGPELRTVLGIPGTSDSELLQWRLELTEDPRTQSATFKLLCVFGRTAPNVPGIAHREGIVEKTGRWVTRESGGASTLVHLLDGGFQLVRLGTDVLHFLGPNQQLLVGNGGWSYTLNRVGGDPAVPPELTRNQPDLPYQLAPLATGPEVFGVFEGRTPAQRIAQELGRTVSKASSKVKWRITLFFPPREGTPGRFRLEGSLFRSGIEGTWTKESPRASEVLFHLKAGEAVSLSFLSRGESLFFLSRDQNLLVGNAEYSYTLDRRNRDKGQR